MTTSNLSTGASVPEGHDDERVSSRVVYRGHIEGRYYLDKWFETEFGKQVPPCAVKSLLPESATFLGAFPAERNDRSFIHLPNGIGLLRGRIVRVIGSTMTMSIEHTSEHLRNRLAAHILWFDQMSHFRGSDRRSFPRFPPLNPHTVVAMPDGNVEPCEIIDMSPSGAAVRSEARPNLDLRVILGQVAGLVARHLDDGFAVKFMRLQNPAVLDDALAPPAHLQVIRPAAPSPEAGRAESPTDACDTEATQTDETYVI